MKLITLACILPLFVPSFAESRPLAGNDDLGHYGQLAIQSYEADANWAVTLSEGLAKSAPYCGDQTKGKTKRWCSTCLQNIISRSNFRSSTMLALFQSFATSCSISESKAGRSAWQVQVSMIENMLASMEAFDPSNSFVHSLRASTKSEKAQLALVIQLENTQIDMSKTNMLMLTKKYIHRLEQKRSLSSISPEEIDRVMLEFFNRLQTLEKKSWQVVMSDKLAHR